MSEVAHGMKAMKGGSSFGEFCRRFSRHRMAMLGFTVLMLEVLAVLVLPLVMELNPNGMDPMAFKAAPSARHWLGTDEIGRDVFSRVIYGTRMSLFIGITSTAISAVLGIVLGLLAGYYRGVLEMAVMRAVDVFQSFPTMMLMLVLSAIFGSSVTNLILVIGILGWTTPAKLIHGKVLSVRSKEYIESVWGIGFKFSPD